VTYAIERSGCSQHHPLSDAIVCTREKSKTTLSLLQPWQNPKRVPDIGMCQFFGSPELLRATGSSTPTSFVGLMSHRFSSASSFDTGQCTSRDLSD